MQAPPEIFIDAEDIAGRSDKADFTAELRELRFVDVGEGEEIEITCAPSSPT